jgi:uncharacterized protein YprB with RNaseH-like and TPR domain
VTDATRIAGRLERYRSWQRHAAGLRDPAPTDPRRAQRLATAIAAAVDGEVVQVAAGTYVRREGASIAVPIDRTALASLPGQPGERTPLICLDTETTGLGTATGTYAFLVGLAHWNGDRLHPLQLLLPDQSEERALLGALADLIPADSWLVTYNGRGFDWPLLVTRYRMGRRSPPEHAGHLDLLPIVRRLFRHRMTDARLATVETTLLDVRRGSDVGGWEIPGRYLAFLRDGSPHHLVDVVRHNAGDVVSLALLLGHIAERLGRRDRWPDAAAGDLAGLSRLFRLDGRTGDALASLDAALAVGSEPAPRRHAPREEEPWWSPRVAVDFGGRHPRGDRALPVGAAYGAEWSDDRLLAERARLLRRLGRIDEALAAWHGVAAGGGHRGIHAWIEIAKLREHVQRDPPGALEAATRARHALERCRALGRPAPSLERDVGHRIGRLRRRSAAVRRVA